MPSRLGLECTGVQHRAYGLRKGEKMDNKGFIYLTKEQEVGVNMLNLENPVREN